MTGIAGCCASAANGHAIAPPPIMPINSRRLIDRPWTDGSTLPHQLSRVVHHSKIQPAPSWVIRYRCARCPAWHDVRSTPKADIRFQRSICRDGPQPDIGVGWYLQKKNPPDIIWRFRCRTLSQLSVELVVQAHAHDVVGEICVRGDSLWSAGSIRSSAGSPSSPESHSGEVFIPPSGNSKPISVLSSIGSTKIPSPSNGPNLPTKSWLQLNASATKRSRHYAANFRFT